jgi:type I restriction enzyme, S subunit
MTLPQNWELVNVGKKAKILRGVSYKKNESFHEPKEGFVPILRATNIQSGGLVLNSDLVFVPEKRVKAEQKLLPGDIVICISSGSKHLVGKAEQLKHEWHGSFGTFCAVARFNPKVNPKYAGYFFNSPLYREEIRNKSSGININNLRINDIFEINIPIPPYSVQESIVTRIEELFTQLDAGVASLQRVKVALKRYKASVLKAAFEGKLINKYSKDSDFDIHTDWMLRSLDEACEIILGQSPPSDTYNTEGIGLPFFQGKAEFGEIYPTPVKWCTKPMKIAKKNDILISVRAPVGPTNLCREESCIGRGLAAIRPRNEMLSKFFLYYLRHIENTWETTGTTFSAITGSVLRKRRIPLPSLSVQHQIVAEVERRLSLDKQAELAVEAGLKRAVRLRQAILNYAFEGRLVA